MDEPDLDLFFAFRAVATAGGFTRAAAEAGLSQSSMSLKVRQLERLLGVRLLERVGRRVGPTAAGAALLVEVERLKAAHEAALAAVAPHRAGHLGRVTIGTGATACLHFLPGPLGSLRRRMPGLEIIVRTGDTSDILADLEANRLDVALVTLPATGRAFVVEELLEDPLVAALPAEESGEAGPIGALELGRHPLILYDSRGATRRIVDDWFARGGVAARPVMELGSVETIRELVAVGLGAAVLPGLAFPPEAMRPTIAVRPLDPPLARRLGLVLRRDKVLDPGLRAMAAELRAAAQGLQAAAASRLRRT
ncbi:MAG: LysR family transcriptional regulator [Hyphomicrobiales bacterium]|nr:LysR family transcriptional regulator [Hyphomicrobiales bacterium]